MRPSSLVNHRHPSSTMPAQSHSGVACFRVSASGLSPSSELIVCGGTAALGSWEPGRGQVLHAVAGRGGLYEGAVEVAAGDACVEYRYFSRGPREVLREVRENRVLVLRRGGGVEVVVQDEAVFPESEEEEVANEWLLVDRIMKTFRSPTKAVGRTN